MRINDTKGSLNELKTSPDQCPYCHNKITPQPLICHIKDGKMQAFMLCPSSPCNKTFIAYFDHWTANSWIFSGNTSTGNMRTKKFTDLLVDVSPSFVIIYNQSYFAEQNGLLEICGVGYRKALEFLIKDYSIANHPNDKDKIEKKLLAQCIGEFVTDDRIKAVAKRAVWLGNDETHYVRKWEGKNLEDLKKLIDLTIHWIEMEELTKSFQNDMPD